MKRVILAAIIVLSATISNAEDTVYMPGGEIRLRAEARNDQDFNAKKYDHFYWGGLRARAQLQAFPNTNLEAMVQAQYTNLFGGSPVRTTDSTFNSALNGGRPAGAGLVDVHQAYFRLKNIFDIPVHLKLGRQELNYGDQRLVGSADYTMVPRHFDGAKLELAAPVSFSLDLFAARTFQGPITRPAAGGPKTPASDTDKGQDLMGAYARTWIIPGVLVDVYELARRDGFRRRFGAEDPKSKPGIELLYTTGARVQVIGLTGLDATGEIAVQNGRRFNVPQKALAWAAKAYYTTPLPLKPGVGAEALFASGDHDGKDGESQGFDPLYPTGHAKLGAMDLFGWTNVRAQRATLGITPIKTFGLFVDGWTFAIPEPGAAGGAGIKPKHPIVSHYAGRELDLTLRWAFYEQVSVLAHYGRFIPGTLLAKQVPAHRNSAEFGMAQIQAQF